MASKTVKDFVGRVSGALSPPKLNASLRKRRSSELESEVSCGSSPQPLCGKRKPESPTESLHCISDASTDITCCQSGAPKVVRKLGSAPVTASANDCAHQDLVANLQVLFADFKQEIRADLTTIGKELVQALDKRLTAAEKLIAEHAIELNRLNAETRKLKGLVERQVQNVSKIDGARSAITELEKKLDDVTSRQPDATTDTQQQQMAGTAKIGTANVSLIRDLVEEASEQRRRADVCNQACSGGHDG